MFSRVLNVEVETVEKHRLDEKKSSYSEILVKGVPESVTKSDINGNDTGML